MSDADAVVDESSRFSLSVPSLDIRGAHFELERGGHTITRLKPVGLRRLTVRVKIDEAGSDDESRGVDGRATRQGIGRDRDDFPAADADISDLIQARLRIDDAAVRDHQIEVLSAKQRREADRDPDDRRVQRIRIASLSRKSEQEYRSGAVASVEFELTDMKSLQSRNLRLYSVKTASNDVPLSAGP